MRSASNTPLCCGGTDIRHFKNRLHVPLGLFTAVLALPARRFLLRVTEKRLQSRRLVQAQFFSPNHASDLNTTPTALKTLGFGSFSHPQQTRGTPINSRFPSASEKNRADVRIGWNPVPLTLGYGCCPRHDYPASTARHQITAAWQLEPAILNHLAEHVDNHIGI